MNMTTMQDTYASLGHLFYSIAAGDGKVRQEEVARLKQLIKEQWLPLEDSRDEFGTDAAHYIDISFDHAHAQAMDAAAAFARFKEAYKADPSRFDAGFRRMIYQTAAAIASAFAGNNKAELGRLAQLEQLFKE
ncbi:MAG TPA: hypothetical protein PLB89_01455 [Flavobacteriales bacterium]|nr:hypothetical protein [Flavobacteriales bacterium]